MDAQKIGERISLRRTQLGMTLDDIANEIGVARSTIQRYEKGTINKMKLPVLEAIARSLKVSPAWLCCKSEEMFPHNHVSPAGNIIDFSKYRSIPVLGRIPAGLPLYAEQNIEGYTLTELDDGEEYFALRVEGDSMNAARIQDGDLLIVRRQPEVDDGEIAIVMVGDEDATVKRFYHTNTTVTLMPQSTNPIHKPQIYDLKTTPIKVLGKVVQVKFSL